MRLIFVGDACVSTGFARATHAVCDELHRAGHEVTVLGIQHYGDPHPYPYPIWPCYQPWDGGRDLFGISRLPLLIERLAPDVVVAMNDPWNVKQYFDAIDGYVAQRKKHGVEVPLPPIVGWLAVDAKNQKGEPLNQLDHVVTWTRFGAEELKAGGYDGEPSIVPLGVDRAIFRPVDRAEARKAVLPADWQDAFVVGVVGRNQSRKRLDLTLEYFADWTRLHHVEGARLLLHVAPTGEAGCDIPALVKYYGLTGRVAMSNPSVGRGLENDRLPLIYGAMDVYVTMSQGEGFGLPALEAMACGVPVIVPNWSGLGDWAREAAALVGCTSTALTAPMNDHPYTIGGVADRRGFIQELDGMYRSEVHRESYRKRGLALAETLPWSRTAREMRAILESVVSEAKAQGEPEPATAEGGA